MKRWPIKLRHIAIIAGVLILIILLADFNNRLADLNRLSGRAEGVQAQATAVMQTQASMQTKIAYATSDEAVEEWARKERYWVRPGETAVVILPGGNVPSSPPPQPALQSPPLENWQVWWELFFGD